MNREKLFLRSLDDLHLSINSGDEYKVLRAAALLRQLFLDGPASLVDQVNRNYRLQLEFFVIQPVGPPENVLAKAVLWGTVDGIDPRRVQCKDKATYIKKDSFLNLNLGYVQGQKYSISDIIKFAANKAGGVHADNAKDGKERAIEILLTTYVFSDLSILLQHLRAIGRVALEALRPLRDKVMKLERFEGASGISVHMVLTLFPSENGDELYILDVGSEENKDRISIFLDSRGELTFRYIDTSGKSRAVRAGAHDCAFRYGVPVYLVFQLGFSGEDLLLHLDTGGWSFVTILPSDQISFETENLLFVLGSDVKGVAHTHMSMMEKYVYTRLPSSVELKQLENYFDGEIRKGYGGSIYFKGNQFLHTQNHPNFH